LGHFLKEKTDGEKVMISDESYSDMMNDLSILQSLTEKEWLEYSKKEDPIYTESWKKLAKDVIDYNLNLIGFLHEKVLNPDTNNFEVKKYTDISGNSNEVWTSSDCFMIKKGRAVGDFRSKVGEM